MKKLIALLLCLTMVLTALVACNDNSSNKEEPTDAPTGNNKEPEKPAEPLLLENLADYTIIYPDMGMNAELNGKIRELREAIKVKFDVTLDMKSDFINKKNPIQEREILISRTNRPESATVYAKAPRLNDYAVQIVDEKLVIAASNDEMLMLVINSVINRITELPEDTTAFFLPETKGRTLEEIEKYFTTGKMPEKK